MHTASNVVNTEAHALSEAAKFAKEYGPGILEGGVGLAADAVAASQGRNVYAERAAQARQNELELRQFEAEQQQNQRQQEQDDWQQRYQEQRKILANVVHQYKRLKAQQQQQRRPQRIHEDTSGGAINLLSEKHVRKLVKSNRFRK